MDSGSDGSIKQHRRMSLVSAHMAQMSSILHFHLILKIQ